MSVLSCNIGKRFWGGKLTFITFDILANYLIMSGCINKKEGVLHIPPYKLDEFVSYMIQSLQIDR